MEPEWQTRDGTRPNTWWQGNWILVQRLRNSIYCYYPQCRGTSKEGVKDLHSLRATVAAYELASGWPTFLPWPPCLPWHTEHPAGCTFFPVLDISIFTSTLHNFPHTIFKLRNGAWKLCLGSMKHPSKSRILSWKVCGRYVVRKDLSDPGQDLFS